MTMEIFRHCGSCKKPILPKDHYYLCNISSCRKTAYCSVPCFDDHVPIFRHKDAWAEEHRAPEKLVSDVPPKDRISTARLLTSETKTKEISRDILVVASKLKDYIKNKSGMNTSANVLERLSDMIRIHCDKAIEKAERDHRKTVMDRDFSL